MSKKERKGKKGTAESLWEDAMDYADWIHRDDKESKQTGQKMIGYCSLCDTFGEIKKILLDTDVTGKRPYDTLTIELGCSDHHKFSYKLTRLFGDSEIESR